MPHSIPWQVDHDHEHEDIKDFMIKRLSYYWSTIIMVNRIIFKVSLRRKSDDFHFCGGSVLTSNAIVTGSFLKLDPVGSIVRYDMMKLCIRSV